MADGSVVLMGRPGERAPVISLPTAVLPPEIPPPEIPIQYRMVPMPKLDIKPIELKNLGPINIPKPMPLEPIAMKPIVFPKLQPMFMQAPSPINVQEPKQLPTLQPMVLQQSTPNSIPTLQPMMMMQEAKKPGIQQVVIRSDPKTNELIYPKLLTVPPWPETYPSDLAGGNGVILFLPGNWNLESKYSNIT